MSSPTRHPEGPRRNQAHQAEPSGSLQCAPFFAAAAAHSPTELTQGSFSIWLAHCNDRFHGEIALAQLASLPSLRRGYPR
jgi:hypothetical protein